MAQLNLDGKSPVDLAIERLRAFEPPEGYYLAFSGGKDSQCIYHLALEAGVKFDAHFQRAVEPPELIYFIRENYPDVEIHLPEKTMWGLIDKHNYGIPPTRLARYCCKFLKELGGADRFRVTGVRWQESARRKRRHMHEASAQGWFLHPIIDWKTEDVWEYLNSRGIPHCSLYDEGWKRLGCVMCPMATSAGMKRDAARWPKIAAAYKRAIAKGMAHRIKPFGATRGGSGMTPAQVYDWWISGKATGEPESCDGFLFEG